MRTISNLRGRVAPSLATRRTRAYPVTERREREDSVMAYIPGGPRPAGPLPEVATAKNDEALRESERGRRAHEVREARESATKPEARAWWKRIFGRGGPEK
jgi:hypothetical protein